MTPHQPRKYLLLLSSYFIAAYIIMLFLVNQQVHWGMWLFVRSTPVYGSAIVCLDIITEVYGYKISRQLIWIGIGLLLFTGIYTHFALKLPYAAGQYQFSQDAKAVFAPDLRNALIASIGITCGQFVNSYLISKWKIMLKGRLFWLRSIGSTFIGICRYRYAELITINQPIYLPCDFNS